MWHVGPFYVTPKFHIGSVGLDTNVLYTPTDRRTDVSGSGGPGLELVLPLGGSARLYTEGDLDYLYFLRTQSQRRLSGSARGGFDFHAPKTSLVIEEQWSDSFSRPTFEVNARIKQSVEATTLALKRRLFSRISLLGSGGRSGYVTPSGEQYLGVALDQTLTRNDYRAGGGLDYALTPKTSFVVEDERSWVRYKFLPARDFDSNRIWGGFRTDATALIAGRALVGRRFYRFQSSPVEGSALVAEVDATWNISFKTKLGGSYTRDIGESILPTTGANPLLTNESYGVHLDKTLGGNVNVILSARRTNLKTQDAVAIVVPGEGAIARKRDDSLRQAGVDLGYLFRPRFRVGVAVSYANQTSTIDYFGIKGLIVGGTVRFNP